MPPHTLESNQQLIMTTKKISPNAMSRRNVLHYSSAAAATALTACGTDNQEELQSDWTRAVNDRIKHSVCFWCFNTSEWAWGLDTIAAHAVDLGISSVELLSPEQWEIVKKHGLTCAIASNGMPDPQFQKGLNNPAYQRTVIETTKKTIDACAEQGIPSVIAFNGYKWNDAEDPQSGEISAREGARNTIEGLEELASYGEEKGVTVCLEMLNTRDDTHPMKGHPGYQGDDIDYCADIIRAVDSPRAKLLFDVYHVQIMNGDIMRRIHEMKDLIGHVHTAGNPGRNELHLKQEIDYASVMEALVEIGYQGYVGHEFIPTRDPRTSLAEAVRLCDI